MRSNFLLSTIIRFRFRLHSLAREDLSIKLISRRNYNQSFIGSNQEAKDKAKEEEIEEENGHRRCRLLETVVLIDSS